MGILVTFPPKYTRFIGKFFLISYSILHTPAKRSRRQVNSNFFFVRKISFSKSVGVKKRLFLKDLRYKRLVFPQFSKFSYNTLSSVRLISFLFPLTIDMMIYAVRGKFISHKRRSQWNHTRLHATTHLKSFR